MMKFSLSQFEESSSRAEEICEKKTTSVPYKKKYNRYCTNCGFPLEDEDVFCIECGSKNQYEESDSTIEKVEYCKEHDTAGISPDRMISILETAKLKSGQMSDEFRKKHLSFCDSFFSGKTVKLESMVQKSSLSPSYYVYKDDIMTQYFSIDNVQGCLVKASVKTKFNNLSYSVEFYEGSIADNILSLHITSSELHPINGISIKLSEELSCLIGEKSIFVNFKGEYSNSVVFKKC